MILYPTLRAPETRFAADGIENIKGFSLLTHDQKRQNNCATDKF